MRRAHHLETLADLHRQFPVVALLGARQVGKTTLARAYAEAAGARAVFFDLEDPRDLARLEAPMLALEPLRGLVVVDEIQRRPDLFPVLRVLADRADRPATFLALGSAAPELLRQSSESLAGRIAYHELGGFDLSEVGIDALERLWLRGGFPRSMLAADDRESMTWRRAFVTSHVERELPALGFRVPGPMAARFWAMLAHYHAQVWNGAELGRALGVTEKTTRHYLDILSGTFMVRRLPPYFVNIGKRQVKAPKVYINDSGLLHALLDISDLEALHRHPKVGASWEGFCIEAVATRLGARRDQCFFWGLHTGAELDLLVTDGDRRLGFEVKRTDAPRVTPSMRSALEILGLERLDVLHAGTQTYPLAARIRAVAMARILVDIPPLASESSARG